jgi:hypothetical protein
MTVHSKHVQLFEAMDASYRRFNAFLDTLTEQQLSVPTDRAGWTGKDHIAHLTVWAGSMLAVLDKQPRWEAMGISFDVWKTIVHTYDEINAELQKQHRDEPLSQVRIEFEDTHRRVVERVKSMTPEELDLPYSHYQPKATDETDPVYLYIQGNTADHYDEHLAYIEGVVSQG